MACPLCLCIAPVLVGGGVGSLVGGAFRTDQGQVKIKIVSGLVATALTGLTMLAVKTFAGIAPCGGQGLTLIKSVTIAATWSVVGLVYFLGVNHLLNKWVAQAQSQKKKPKQELSQKELEQVKEALNESTPPCCRTKKGVA